MKPINIYSISRMCDEELFNINMRHESADLSGRRIRVHEIISLRILADSLTDSGMTVREADGFYFGFTIPQIGKEFDLLKITDRHCLNIELKSQDVGEEAIADQLRKNRHYLGYLGKRLLLYTVVTDTMTCYKLSLSDNLVRADIRELSEVIQKCDTPYNEEIEHLFRASEYLISPTDTPDKFIKGKYFLTPAQDQVKKDILKGIDRAGLPADDGDIESSDRHSGAFFHITGRPGTGKTLLLYDLAKTLSGNGLALMIHCSELSEGERIISREITNLDIVSTVSLRNGGAEARACAPELGNYDFILVDESHRLSSEEFEAICSSASASDQICIFSSDPERILTNAEKKRDIAGRINALPPDGTFELSERLRMNRELYAFIMTLRHLSYKPDSTYDYDEVSVNYANDTIEAVRLISYFRSQGYVFIDARIPAPDAGSDPFAEIAEEFDVRHLIGSEYDKVVMLMDSSFYYDKDGFLNGIPAPDPEALYPNLFYQGITRVRDRLSLVILDAPDLYRRIISIIK